MPSEPALPSACNVCVRAFVQARQVIGRASKIFSIMLCSSKSKWCSNVFPLISSYSFSFSLFLFLFVFFPKARGEKELKQIKILANVGVTSKSKRCPNYSLQFFFFFFIILTYFFLLSSLFIIIFFYLRLSANFIFYHYFYLSFNASEFWTFGYLIRNSIGIFELPDWKLLRMLVMEKVMIEDRRVLNARVLQLTKWWRDCMQ